jgi:Mg-chelatase subunit ChlD
VLQADGIDDTVLPSVSLTLAGNQVGTLTVESAGESLLNNEMPGYIGKAYEFSVDGIFDTATISFEFDPELLIDPSFDPVIYYFNETTQELEALSTTVTGNIAYATVTHFSTYILLNKNAFDKVWEEEISQPGTHIAIDVALVIDESGSMSYDSSPKNDRDGIRFLVAKKIVEKLSGQDRAAIIKFASSATLVQNFTAIKTDLQTAIDSYFYPGKTAMYNGIKIANDAFTSFFNSPDVRKVMIVLTDGVDNASSYSLSSVVNVAQANGIIIYTVGLGNSLDETSLIRLADDTGGKYYHAASAGELIEIYDEIGDETINLTLDSDNDGIIDYYEDKIRSASGVKLNLDKNNPDCDGDGLLDGEEVTITVASNETIYAMLKSNPNKHDSDGDGYNDKEDISPMKWNVGERDLAMFAALTYEEPSAYRTGNLVGSDDEPGERYYFLDFARSSEVRGQWSIVDFTKEWCDVNTYFEATTYKNDDSVIIAIRGTDEGFGEWVNNLLGYGLFNWHVEEGKARAYAKKIAREYPSCDLYIAGHSLGGYLTQIAAAELYKDSKQNQVKNIAYFNGMGLFPGTSILTSLWIAKSDEANALKSYNSQGKLTAHRIKGDLVSALGTHFGVIKEYEPTDAAIRNHDGRQENNWEWHWWEFGVGTLIRESIEGIGTGVHNAGAYVWYTHETDSFFYYIKQGTRG